MLVALSALKFKFVNIHFTNKVFTWHENVPFNFMNFMMTNKHWQKHFKRILITFALKYPYCWLIMWVRLIGHSWHFPQHNSAVSPIFKQRHLFFSINWSWIMSQRFLNESIQTQRGENSHRNQGYGVGILEWTLK